MQDKGQIIRVNCKRCGFKMLKWERIPRELDAIHPYPFDKICGHCLTKQEVDFWKKTGGLIMTYEKEITGVFTYNSESKKFTKFMFAAEEGAVGYIFFPKGIKQIPLRIILDSDIRKEIKMNINDTENK